MENEANGLTDSSVARHSRDRTLRLELISRNQNGSRHDQGTGMGAEVRNIEYSIALKMKRGELMVPVWDYVAGRLGEGGRCKSNSPKLKLRSQLLFTATQNFDRRGIVKNWFGKLQNNVTKIVIVSRLQLPLGGTLRYLYKKNIVSFYLIKTKTSHRFIRHQNEHSMRVKWF